MFLPIIINVIVVENPMQLLVDKNTLTLDGSEARGRNLLPPRFIVQRKNLYIHRIIVLWMTFCGRDDTNISRQNELIILSGRDIPKSAEMPERRVGGVPKLTGRQWRGRYCPVVSVGWISNKEVIETKTGANETVARAQ